MNLPRRLKSQSEHRKVITYLIIIPPVPRQNGCATAGAGNIMSSGRLTARSMSLTSGNLIHEAEFMKQDSCMWIQEARFIEHLF